MIIYSRKDDTPIQTLRSFPTGVSISMNGKYLLDFPDTFEVGDMSDTPSNIAENIIKPQFLVEYPSYDYVVYNPLLSSVGVFDTTARYPAPTGSVPSRCKIGGAPNTCSILRNNLAAGRPGVGITEEIDIAGETDDGLGRETYLLYWRAVTKGVSHDVSPVGDSTENTPALVTYSEMEDGAQYSVYISSDGGITYQRIEKLTPFSFSTRANSVRLAFINEGDSDLYILSYALMF
jgi:hypothetical protein